MFQYHRSRSRRAFFESAASMLAMLLAAGGCAGGGSTGTVSASRPLSSLVLPGKPPAKIVEPEAPELVPTAPLKILPRSFWADARPIEDRLVPLGKVTRLTIHHEGGSDIAEESSVEGVKAELRRIRKYHLTHMQAGDIGYHYIIDYNGRIWEGRPVKYQGAHAGNNDANRGNIGVVVLGNFNIQRPTPAQLSSLRTLVDHLMKQYGLRTSQVHTHREVRKAHGLGTTDCPGQYLQTQVNLMRRNIAEAETK